MKPWKWKKLRVEGKTEKMNVEKNIFRRSEIPEETIMGTEPILDIATTLAAFFEAWQTQDWERMTRMCVATKSAVIKGICSGFDIISYSEFMRKEISENEQIVYIRMNFDVSGNTKRKIRNRQMSLRMQRESMQDKWLIDTHSLFEPF